MSPTGQNNNPLAELQMNEKSIWEPIAAAQHALFESEYVLKMGEYFRVQSGKRKEDDTDDWPTIPLEKCLFPQAQNLPHPCAGYDLPITITPEKWNGKMVAFVSQDPLRKPKKNENRFSIATPWGFSSPAQRLKAGNRKIWPSVEALCRAGFGVYMTDVAKLYFHDKNKGKSKETSAIEQEVFRCEQKTVDPALWVALGREATTASSNSGVSDFDIHPHPTAYVKTLTEHYKVNDGKHCTIGKAMKAQIFKRLRTTMQQ